MVKNTLTRAGELLVTEPDMLAFYGGQKAINLADPLTERVVGNKAGTLQNLVGYGDIYKNRRNSGVKRNGDPDVETLRTNHLLTLEDAFEPSVIETISSKFQERIEDPERSIVRSEYDGEVYSRMVPGTWAQIPEVKQLLTPEIKDLIEQYYGCHFRVRHVHSWRNYHVPDDVIEEAGSIISDHWHSDPKPRSWFKLFVLLSDCDERHGPMHVLPKPATERVVRNYAGEDHGRGFLREKLSDTNSVVKFTGEAGSAVLANTEVCLHRAGFPDEGQIRDILQFQFVPAAEPLDDDWPEDVLPKRLEEEWVTNNLGRTPIGSRRW